MKQYGLTQEEFEYWNQLAKSTERTGSLFDPQPSSVTGNIKSQGDPSEMVFGYFSAANRQDERIFVQPNLGRNRFCEPTDTLEQKRGN